MDHGENKEAPELLWYMAQRASANPALLAQAINDYAGQEGLRWPELAHQWRIQPEQLARLALCVRPQSQADDGDLAQMAAYTGIAKRPLQDILLTLGVANGRSAPHLWQRVRHTILQQRRVMVAAAAAFIFLLVSAFVLAQPEPGTPATLVVFEGQAVVVQRSALPLVTSGSAVEVAAGHMLAVRAGDKITLGLNDAAQLRLYDGSTVDLFEDTSLEINELLTHEKSYRVRLTLLAGRTLSSVSRALGAGDAFEIRTPSSTASVRGTIFRVEVITADWTYVACDEGVVRVVMGEQSVELQAGEEVNAILERPLLVQPQHVPAPPPAPTPAPTTQPTPLPTPTAIFGEPEAAAPTAEADALPEADAPTPAIAPEVDVPAITPTLRSVPPPLPTQAPPLPTQAAPPLPTLPPAAPPPPDPQPGPPPSVPNPPPEVPGNPPGDTPGNPPGGGGVPPGQGGLPPGQTRP